MITQEDLEIAVELKQRLSQVLALVDFKVYGSRAKGSAVEGSDMDIFIEVEMLNRDIKEKIREIAWEVGFKHLLHISPLIFTRHEIEESPLRASDIVRKHLRAGSCRMTDRESLLSYRLNQAEETLAEAERMLSENFSPDLLPTGPIIQCFTP